MQDIRVWKADPSGIYSTKSAYRLLRTSNPIPEANILKTIWKLNVPPRAAIFSWRLILDRLPTRGNLLRRNVQMQDNSCPLYNRWKTWWIALTWSIWKHQNVVIFHNAQFNGIKMLEDAVFLH